MEEIKVGEYVRTQNGLIGKVNKIELAGSGCRFVGEFLTDEIIQFDDGKAYERRVKRRQVTNHRKNIIDLIEVGDYINGELVTGFGYEDVNGAKEKSILVEGKYTKVSFALLEWDIKSILTKEQFEQNSYKV